MDDYNIDLSEGIKSIFPQSIPVPDLAACYEGLRKNLPSYNLNPKPQTNVTSRITTEEIRKRACSSMARGLRPFKIVKNDSDTWVICGAGPSLIDSIPTIRKLKRQGAYIITLNKTHDLLLEHGITPWGHILLDPMPWVAEYVKRPRMDVRYFVASQCHDDVFEALKGYPVFLWHAAQDIEDGTSEPNIILRKLWPNKPWWCIPGPTTVGLRAPFLASQMGPVRPRVFHLIGFDSSREGTKLHAMPKKEAEDAVSGTVTLTYKGARYQFDTNNHMKRQAEDFDGIIDNMMEYWKRDYLPKDIDLIVHGRGLLPFRAACLGLHATANDNPGSVVAPYIPKRGGAKFIPELKHLPLTADAL